MLELTLRKVKLEDKQALSEVELAATPNLQYVPQVFEQFRKDDPESFFLAETEEKIVACAKFTVLPDNSAWLETLRVIPESQGRGVGKQLYKRFFELANAKQVKTMRMYTGINNAKSKGLAEHFGFKIEQTFLEYSLDSHAFSQERSERSFVKLADLHKATRLIMSKAANWQSFSVMNRTFYPLTPELCAYFVEQGFVYEHADSGSLVICGARFMPEQALHLAFFVGDDELCLNFVKQKAAELKVPKIISAFPRQSDLTKNSLVTQGWAEGPSPLIAMKVNL